MAIRAGVNTGLLIDSGAILVLVGVHRSHAFCVFWFAAYTLIITLPLLPHGGIDSQFLTSMGFGLRDMKVDVKVDAKDKIKVAKVAVCPVKAPRRTRPKIFLPEYITHSLY
jgi:hypothetical protein